MNLKEQVKLSLKWKKSDEICARRLKIPTKQYRQIKDELRTELINRFKEAAIKDHPSTSVKFDEDTQNQKATIEYTGPNQIKTKEDLVRECEIDLTQWEITRMIHNAWGKDGNRNFQTKAFLSPIKESPSDILSQVLRDYEFSYTPTQTPILNKTFEEKTCAILSLQDIHVGKENIDSLDTIVDDTKKCITSLVQRAYHSNNLDKIVFVLGGDLVNMDTYLGSTTSGTLIENSMPAYEAYKAAFDLMFWAINFTKEYCNELEVVYIPGNHSRLTEAHIAYALSKCITTPNITWNIDYAERKVVVYGDNMLCMEHGDFDTKKSFYVFATEFAKQWGSCSTRTLYTGHYHKEKTIQYITRDETNGFTIKILPSLSKTDMYHYSNKWTGNKRGGMIEFYSEFQGCTGNFSHYA